MKKGCAPVFYSDDAFMASYEWNDINPVELNKWHYWDEVYNPIGPFNTSEEAIISYWSIP